MTREPTEAEINVAMALAQCDGIKPSPGAPKQYLTKARAAIRALHEPTYAMRCSYRQMDTAHENYQHYIDAASPKITDLHNSKEP